MPTLQTIRQTLSNRSGWYNRITATSGSTNTIVDTEKLKDTGASNYDHVDNYFKCIQAVNAGNLGKIRRCSSFIASSGTVTFGNDLGSTVSAGDIFEEHQIDPEVLDSCINDALRRCTTIKRDLLTYSAGDTIINVTSQFAWITEVENILGLRYRHGTVANQYQFTDISPHQYKVTSDAGVIFIEFEDTPLHGTGIAIEVKSIGPHLIDGESLSTDSSSTNCPLDWIVPMATVELLNRIAKNTDLRDRGIVRLDRNEAIKDAEEATLKFAPSINYELRII